MGGSLSSALANGLLHILGFDILMLRQREQMTREREQMTREREQMTREREQMTREREQMTREREQMTREREQMTREREQMTRGLASEREQMTREREQMTREREQMTSGLASEREQMTSVLANALARLREKEAEKARLREEAEKARLREEAEKARRSSDSDSEREAERATVLPQHLRRSFEFLPPNMSELRVVLLGNSWSERSSVGNFILGGTVFNTEEEPDCYQTVRGQLKEKEIVLINTPDLLNPNISEDNLTEHVETCVSLSDPGPHVFLLVLQPEDFTEKHKLKMLRVLEKFGGRPFDHSLILISTPREEKPGFMEEYRQHPPLNDLIIICRDRFLWRKNLELEELLTRFGQIVKENNGEHLKP